MYSDNIPNKIVEMVFVINTTGSSSSYADVHHTLKQQFQSDLIFEVPMSMQYASQGNTQDQN